MSANNPNKPPLVMEGWGTDAERLALDLTQLPVGYRFFVLSVGPLPAIMHTVGPGTTLNSRVWLDQDVLPDDVLIQGDLHVIGASALDGGATVGTVGTPSNLAVHGNFTQDQGTVSIQPNGASLFKTSAGALTLDSTGAPTNVGNVSATAVAVGHSGVTTTITGNLTQLTGAVSLTGNAASQVSTSAGALTLDAGAAINLGGTTAGTVATAVNLARTGIVTTLLGPILLNEALRMVLADAGAAGAAGTASAYAGTFTVSVGTTVYTLTNTKILATSILLTCCISGAVAQSVYSFVPNGAGGSAILTLSGAAGANAKFGFLVINP